MEDTFESAGIRWEYIFASDSSTDGTETWLNAMAPLFGRIKPVFIPSSGKAAALAAGIAHARGEWIATLDGDLQNDPRDLLQLWRERDRG